MATENTHFGYERISEMLKGCKSIFFIGIGGINMSSLAHISFLRGYRVGGSDRVSTELTKRLEECGIEVFYEHKGENIDSYDAVVYTVAISPDNPEYVRANERGIPCISRADYMGYLMKGYKRRVGISGMHGKSTCTLMCAELFADAEVDPTVLSGAAMKSMGGAYRVGGEDNFIFEACEYMDSFLDFYPTVAVILNIEMDHVDYFKSMDQIYKSFRAFADKTLPTGGCVIANGDDENVKRALEGFDGRVISFSTLDKDATFYATNIELVRGRPEFDVLLMGEHFCHIKLSVSGSHNVYNALAACAAAYLCGIGGEKVSAGLAKFCGAGRRMEFKGKFCGADVYDDYGHHPTEVRKTLEGVAQMGYRHVYCVFQPHTFSRTAGLFDELTGSFGSVDEAIIADIYPAREKDTGIVSAARVAKSTPNGRYVGGFVEIAEYLKGKLEGDDVLVVMGAGDIYKMFDLMDLE